MSDRPAGASPGEATRLLRAWRGGDARALDDLTPIVYAELRRRAARSMRGERPGHSLRGTELVHEAFLRLVDADVSWADRAHFLAVATRSMRRILVDHARARTRSKRGGDRLAADLDDELVPAPEPAADPESLLALDRALTELQARDPQSAAAVAMSLFGGMGVRDIAEVLGISKSGVQRQISFAKAWLRRRMQPPPARP